MHKNHGLVIKPRESDYVLGTNSPLFFPVVLPVGDWRPHQCFDEKQKNDLFDNDGCACYFSNKGLDAWMDFLISQGTISGDLLAQITSLGYMDSNSKDSKPHFHSSPRYTENLTGNGINGNSLPECLDVIRKYGAVPWTLFPFTPTMTQAEYFTAPSQDLMNLGAKFLNLMGGKNFLQYHWLINGGSKNIFLMSQAIKQTPLGIGIAVTNEYNQSVPTDPPASQSPQHALFVGYVLPPDTNVSDNYIPYDKTLDAGYPINYVIQMKVNPIVPPPLPAPLPPNPSNSQISSWLTSVSKWLSTLINIFSYKGIPDDQKVASSEIEMSSNFMSNLFSLNWRDLGKGAVTAVFSAVVLALGTAAQSSNFDVFTYDWASIGKLALSAFVAYMLKNFLSTPDGKVLGKI